MKRVDKKAAIELSIGTIVIVVLAMSMLILGLLLIKEIFFGVNYNVNSINDKVRDEIGKLFVENKKTVVYLEGQKLEIEQGEDWGVAFAIRNIQKGTAEAGKFSYEVFVSDPNVRKNCGLGDAEVEGWIKTGQSDIVDIAPGDTYYGVVRFEIPESSPLCPVRFHLEVMKDNVAYATDFFDVETIA